MELSLATSSAYQTLARCSPFIIFFEVSIAKGNSIRRGNEVYGDRDDSPYVISRTFSLKFAMLSTFKYASIVITMLLFGITKGEIVGDLPWFVSVKRNTSIHSQSATVAEILFLRYRGFTAIFIKRELGSARTPQRVIELFLILYERFNRLKRQIIRKRFI